MNTVNQPIELRRVRDFSQIINDTFTFVKDHFKPLFKALLTICGPLIVAQSLLYTLLVNSNSLMNPFVQMQNSGSPLSAFTPQFFIYYIIYVLLTFSAILVPYAYIAVFNENTTSKPTIPEVWGYFRYYFFRTLGSSVLIVTCIFIGFLFCLIPGIYLYVVFSLFLPIMVFENASFSYAFEKSFKLIKNNWWITFGIIIVMGLIVSISVSIMGTPTALLMFLKTLFHWGNFTTPLFFFSSLLTGLGMLLYSLLAITQSLCYFSYLEQKEGTGLLERIDSFGQAPSNTTHSSPEEY